MLLTGDEVIGSITPEAHHTERAPLVYAATWLREAAHPIFLEDTSPEVVQQKLRAEVDAERAFRLFLPFFDNDPEKGLPVDLRGRIGDEIERLFTQRPLHRPRVMGRFYGDPFPELPRLEAALALASDRPWPLLHESLCALRECQPIIREVCLAWAAILPEEVTDSWPAAQVRRTLAYWGSFHRLVDTLAAKASLETFVTQELASRNLAGIPHLKQWLTAWVRVFAYEAVQEEESLPDELWQQANQIMDDIADSVRQRKTSKLESGCQQLLDALLPRGFAKYAQIFLGQLTNHAKNSSASAAQELLARLAWEINPSHLLSTIQYADALTNLRRFPEALTVLNRSAEEHGDNVHLSCRIAKVLHLSGDLEKALVVYEATVVAHPESVVARNGMADLFRELNQLADALQSYGRAISAPTQRALAEEEQQIRAQMEHYQTFIEQAPKIAEEQRRARREQLVKRGFGASVALADRRYDLNVSTPAHQRRLRHERNKGRLTFFVLTIIFAAVVTWLYYTVTRG